MKNGRLVKKRSRRRLPVSVDARKRSHPQIGTVSVGADYDDDEREFMITMDTYKRERRRLFPTWSEVLAVLRSLGYRKVADRTELPP